MVFRRIGKALEIVKTVLNIITTQLLQLHLEVRAINKSKGMVDRYLTFGAGGIYEMVRR